MTTWIMRLEARLGDRREQLAEIRAFMRTMRGHDGTRGVHARVVALRQELEILVASLERAQLQLDQLSV